MKLGKLVRWPLWNHQGALIGTTTLCSLCALIIRVEHYLFESGYIKPITAVLKNSNSFCPVMLSVAKVPEKDLTFS